MDQEVFEAEVEGVVDGGLIFGGIEGAVEGGAVVGDGDGGVLAHEGEGEPAAEFLAEEVKDAQGIVDVAGQDEMTYQHAALGEVGARGVEGIEEAFFGDHEAEGFEGDFGVAFVAHDEAGEGGVGELEVGEEDVHEGGIARDHGGELVAGGIEEEGEGDAFVAEAGAEGFDVGPEVVGGDEVEVVDAEIEKGEGEAVEFVRGGGLAFAVRVGDLPILAEEAVAGAAGEEEGSGTADAGEAGFFAQVGAVGGDAQMGGFAADAGDAREAVGGALARTEAAGGVGRGIHFRQDDRIYWMGSFIRVEV